MEHWLQDQQPAGHATARESAGRGSRAGGPDPSGDGLLAELARLDELLQERGAAWKELVRRLDALRREIVVTSTQVQRSRSLAAREASLLDGDADQEARPLPPSRDEARATGLKQEFEVVLREAEERRVALHAEMDDLRRHRQALLKRLPAPLSLAYQSLADTGRVPAIAAVAKGACGGCGSPLTESVIDTLRHGAVAVCARCERLLQLARNVE